jgi:hypothetical protein
MSQCFACHYVLERSGIRVVEKIAVVDQAAGYELGRKWEPVAANWKKSLAAGTLCVQTGGLPPCDEELFEIIGEVLARRL